VSSGRWPKSAGAQPVATLAPTQRDVEHGKAPSAIASFAISLKQKTVVNTSTLAARVS
jgi:hypothetical protein